MIYKVRKGDTLHTIAKAHNTSVQALARYNSICDPSYIYTGEILLIPGKQSQDIQAGGTPYYIVRSGDTLHCIASIFRTTQKVLAQANSINDPDLIFPYTELLIVPSIPSPEELKKLWVETGDKYRGTMNPLQIHGIYYNGSFVWEALREKAIPHLVELLRHKCEIVRFYAVLSLGRIAADGLARRALALAKKDPVEYVANTTAYSLERIDLKKSGLGRIHILTMDNSIYSSPAAGSPSKSVPAGTKVVALKWFIPGNAGNEGGPGGIPVYDYVQLVDDGTIGFMPRLGYNEITMV